MQRIEWLSIARDVLDAFTYVIPIEDARQLLEDAGLTLGTVTDRPDADRPEGTVIEQSPAAGVEVGNGAPVNVVVSNFGKQRMLLKPSDILLHGEKEVIDPVPVETVMAVATRQKSFLRDSTKEEVDRYFERSAFKETTLSPGDTYSGVMFFAVPAPKRRLDRFFTSWNVYRRSGPKMRIGLTNLESGERVLFPPFSITLPEDAGRFSY